MEFSFKRTRASKTEFRRKKSRSESTISSKQGK
jgi:hypothetical protein